MTLKAISLRHKLARIGVQPGDASIDAIYEYEKDLGERDFRCYEHVDLVAGRLLDLRNQNRVVPFLCPTRVVADKTEQLKFT